MANLFLRRFFMSSDNLQQEHPCPFCDESFLTSDRMRTHLTQCASKTNQCPVCRKYIVRSIFAYHTDHNCTDPDLLNEVSAEKFKTGE